MCSQSFGRCSSSGWAFAGIYKFILKVVQNRVIKNTMSITMVAKVITVAIWIWNRIEIIDTLAKKDEWVYFKLVSRSWSCASIEAM